MVKAESMPKDSKPSDNDIVKAVLKNIGGAPENFAKSTVTQVHENTFRVNIYTAAPGGEFGFLKQYKIAHSEFYFLPG